ncbi:hypothetical protein DRP05_10815 [Archaeoglobales archaeon]|nr:MAG: hypothetical protein DRP05_10815 [Archaeoglobales archaeon]
MKIKVKFIGFQKEEGFVEIERNKRYVDLLNKLDINPETVVVVKDGLPVPVDDEIEEGEIKVIRVISGG